MKRTFPTTEAAMYPLIKDYFLGDLKFHAAFVDIRDQQFARLKKNLRIREVDVVALKSPNGASPQVDLVEAKMFAKGHSFEECFSQVDSVRDSGDRLWLAFPECEWRLLEDGDRKRNEKRLNDFDFGLLLVSEHECYAEIKAPPNRHVTDAGRLEVLQQFGFAEDVFLPSVPTLGIAEARVAAGTMALMCMVADILNEIETRKVGFQAYDQWEYDKEFVSRGWYVPLLNLKGSITVEFDPFGCFLKDGVPVVWVVAPMPIERVYSTMKRATNFGTHIYIDDGLGWKWNTIPLADGVDAVRYWVERGLNDAANIVHRIEIVGRAREPLKSQLKSVIAEGRRLQAKDGNSKKNV